jgi:protein-S-isoprenylcysteine O-methyltransferase Ste14
VSYGLTMRLSVSSTSTRTFTIYPALVLAEQAVSRRPLHRRWLPVMAAGFALYKGAGTYRISRAGGPAGMSQGMPEKVIDTGPYAFTRNPMYLGHMVFLAGLTLLTRSPFAAALLTTVVAWFDERAVHDERRLEKAFGEEYVAYRDRVPRWIGSPKSR